MGQSKVEKSPQSEGQRRAFSRRKLLAGGFAATAALPALHELVPHQGIHKALDGSSTAAASEHAGTEMGGHEMPAAGSGHPGHGSAGAPLHAGFDPATDVDHVALSLIHI